MRKKNNENIRSNFFVERLKNFVNDRSHVSADRRLEAKSAICDMIGLSLQFFFSVIISGANA